MSEYRVLKAHLYAASSSMEEASASLRDASASLRDAIDCMNTYKFLIEANPGLLGSLYEEKQRVDEIREWLWGKEVHP